MPSTFYQPATKKYEQISLKDLPASSFRFDNFLPHVVFVPSLRRVDFGPRSVNITSIKTEVRGQASTKEA